MARRGATYPQVEPGVESLMTEAIVRCPATTTVKRALGLARRRGASLLVIGARAAARASDLVEASRLGLGGAPVNGLALFDCPVVAMSVPEIAVRRLLLEGASVVLVKRGGRTVGAVDATASSMARPALSVAHRLEPASDPATDARLWLLRLAGKVGEAAGMPVYAVGGIVRDLLLGRAALDVDLVVEGDGGDFARRLAAEVGGRVLAHRDFGTASIEGARTAGGTELGRVDVATARRERYAAPGALPVVEAASLDVDLGRRDFSINAIAVALAPSAWGRLTEVAGAQRDLRERRLRPLSPLSFVEDPTRIFRAARYAARLGFRLHPVGTRAVGLALVAGEFPALAGQRLYAELELIAREPSGWNAVARLVEWHAFRIWDRRYRATDAVRKRLADARKLTRWAAAADQVLDTEELMLLSVLIDQSPRVVGRCLARLAVTGAPARRLAAAAGAARRLLGRLDRDRLSPSAVDELLRPCSPATVAAAWLLGGTAARRRIKWFLARGRLVRPVLSGDDLVGLGVPHGPAVGRALAELRRRRLDGIVSSRHEEEAFVNQWRLVEKGDSR